MLLWQISNLLYALNAMKNVSVANASTVAKNVEVGTESQFGARKK